MEKPDKHQPTQVIKEYISSNATNWNYVPLDRMQSEEKERNFCNIPVKDIYTESNHKETSDKLKQREILEDKMPVIFKCQGHDSPKQTEQLFRLKKTKKTWLLNRTCDSE